MSWAGQYAQDLSVIHLWRQCILQPSDMYIRSSRILPDSEKELCTELKFAFSHCVKRTRRGVAESILSIQLTYLWIKLKERK